MVWETIKELFFFTGSVAGLFAFFLPLINHKLANDKMKIQTVLALIPEEFLHELQAEIDTGRILKQHWSPFYDLQRWEFTESDRLRFSGPLAKDIKQEVEGILTSFRLLMELLKSPWWSSEFIEGQIFCNVLDKDDYIHRSPENSNYAHHLKECSDCIEQIKKGHKRLRIISEMHALELPVARFLLNHRFKINKLSNN
jgi:hypothetical protein